MIVIMFDAIADLNHTTRKFRKGQFLFRQDDPVRSMYFIESGEARLVRGHRDGSAITLQRATAGHFLAEASLFVARYHCDAVASQGLVTRVISRNVLRELFESDVKFAAEWARYLAEQIRIARLRAEILSLKTVAARLDFWITLNGKLPVKGSMKEVAQDIGVSPEALYRDMALRKN
jgi:CRP/FNR family transcriptional regulator, dissimilatory nitrate respiration regulator